MKIEKADKDKLFLRQIIATGKFRNEKITFSQSVNGAFFFVEFEDKEIYVISSASIIKDVIKFREKEKKILKND
jgi:hypothetical protein